MNSFLSMLGRNLAHFLTQPAKSFLPLATGNPEAFKRTLRRGDVVLIEGNTRVAHRNQVSYSINLVAFGDVCRTHSRTLRASGEPHSMVEAEPEHGVVSVPVSKYAACHTRICRPVGLSEAEAQRVIDFIVQRIGHSYDLRNVFDLMRYFLPMPPVPTRFRRRMIAIGAGDPTRAICSTMIAQAFQSIEYPILPTLESVANAARASEAPESVEAGEGRARELQHIRHYSLFTPRDFDISPYFAIVKPTIEIGFDYRKVEWTRRSTEDRRR